MEPARGLAWSLRLLVLLLLRQVHAGWVKGAAGLSCDDACAAASGQICSQEGNRRINFDYEMQYLMEINVTECVPDQEGEDPFRVVTDTGSAFYTLQPFRLEIPGLPETACYIFGEGSTCDSSNALARRICCCVAGGASDVSAECFLPTTTSTTISMTTSKTTSFTEEEAEEEEGKMGGGGGRWKGVTTTQTTTISVTRTATTTVTHTATETTTSATQTTTISVTSSTTTTTRTLTTSVTTTSQTTSISFTQTTTTTSVTQTSVTSSTSTITSATSTYTGTVTETSTISTTTLTGTTRTETTTISITTTFSTSTTTATTTTVTPRANTDITRDVAAGATQIAVDSTLGFSIGDIALIRSREPVEIINITYEVRRLEAVDEGFFSETDESEEAAWRRLNVDNTIAILDVTPPVERAYPAGTRIINAGPAISYTGSDPITFFGGQKFKFWFPLHEEMLMLQTPELRIYGQVFPGPELGLQWFGHLRVLRTDGTPVARVSIKQGVNQTSSRCSSRKLDSLDVFLGTSASPLRELNRRPMEFVAGKDVRFELNCRQQARPQLASSRTEYLHFETPSIAFLIVAAHAGNEFPNDAKLALKYKHLDFLILEMPRKESFTGVLPEIWGLVPRVQGIGVVAFACKLWRDFALSFPMPQTPAEIAAKMVRKMTVADIAKVFEELHLETRRESASCFVQPLARTWLRRLFGGCAPVLLWGGCKAWRTSKRLPRSAGRRRRKTTSWWATSCATHISRPCQDRSKKCKQVAAEDEAK
eukprot:s183_g15.t2